MKTLSIVRAILACAALALIVSVGRKDSKSQEPAGQPDGFMSQKRLYSQIVLEGLMRGQYAVIVTWGEKMKHMSQDIRWQQFSTKEYQQQSERFQSSVRIVVNAARAKQLDVAMDAYLKSLQNCYDCHKYVRDQQHLSLQPTTTLQ